MDKFITALRSGKVLLMDGAMGTEILRQLRSPAVERLDGYNLSHAGLIEKIHRSYLDAGAEVLLTNTFQTNPAVLARSGREKQHDEIWQAAIDLAHRDRLRPHFVIADVGPIEKTTHKIVAGILAQCANVDGVLLETWSSLDALKRFADRPKLPLLVSFTFHRTSDLMTITGSKPEACARAAQRCGAQAVGANCGKKIGMEDFREIVRRYRAACDLPIFIRPNAGTPTQKGWRYPRSPATMAAGLLPILEAGAAMVGGCCGTTPDHIKAFRRVVDAWNG